MGYPRNSGEWCKAIDNALRADRIKNHEALTAFRLATVINWRPKEPERQGRPALYWQNEAAAKYLGINWRSFERHRSALRKAGLIGNEVIDGSDNLVPLLPVASDAVIGDADTHDGPYEELSFKEEPIQGSSFEVDRGTVAHDGALAGAAAKSAWGQSSHGGSTTPAPAALTSIAPSTWPRSPATQQ